MISDIQEVSSYSPFYQLMYRIFHQLNYCALFLEKNYSEPHDNTKLIKDLIDSDLKIGTVNGVHIYYTLNGRTQESILREIYHKLNVYLKENKSKCDIIFNVAIIELQINNQIENLREVCKSLSKHIDLFSVPLVEPMWILEDCRKKVNVCETVNNYEIHIQEPFLLLNVDVKISKLLVDYICKDSKREDIGQFNKFKTHLIHNIV